jgi:L-2,4-diaminobutyrate decarboxylase
VRDGASLQPALIHADYLNPERDDEDEELPNLVDKSLQTTRRFDALKLFVALRAHGRRLLGEAVEATIDLAAEAARLIDAEPRLELARPASLNTVLFRSVPRSPAGAAELDAINEQVRLGLLHGGGAVIGRTRLDGRVHLKLTLMNPATGHGDLRELLARITGRGRWRGARRAASGLTWARRSRTPPAAHERGAGRNGSAATARRSSSPCSPRSPATR